MKVEREEAKVLYEIEQDIKIQRKQNDYARFMEKQRSKRLKKIGYERG